ncbi:MAG: PDC sensor domain-containing protein [Deltaproteobacteria bacterium]|nr:PDC sensor domain-containing protein [Deltaproteobacteria bacterium]
MEQGRQALQKSLEDLDALVAGAAVSLGQTGLKGRPAEEVLAGLCRQAALASDCAALGPRGLLAARGPAGYQRFTVAELDREPWQKRLREQRRPVLSKLFWTTEGVWGVDLERPVLDADGQFLGSVSLVFNPARLAGQVLEPLRDQSRLSFYLLQTDGMMLYHSHPEEIGLNVLEVPLISQDEAAARVVRRVVSQPRGDAGPCPVLSEGLPAPETCSNLWTTVTLHGVEWRLGVAAGKP